MPFYAGTLEDYDTADGYLVLGWEGRPIVATQKHHVQACAEVACITDFLEWK